MNGSLRPGREAWPSLGVCVTLSPVPGQWLDQPLPPERPFQDVASQGGCADGESALRVWESAVAGTPFLKSVPSPTKQGSHRTWRPRSSVKMHKGAPCRGSGALPIAPPVV